MTKSELIEIITAKQKHLPAKDVEILTRRGHIANLDIVLGRQLQEPLDAGARVLRPLALVAVRQQ